LRFDSLDDEFFCTNIDARWDRVGRVVTRPPGTHLSDPLQVALAKVAWDGRVMLNRDELSEPPDSSAVRLLWPTWQTAH
jgi:hypothetical protein